MNAVANWIKNILVTHGLHVLLVGFILAEVVIIGFSIVIAIKYGILSGLGFWFLKTCANAVLCLCLFVAVLFLKGNEKNWGEKPGSEGRN